MPAEGLTGPEDLKLSYIYQVVPHRAVAEVSKIGNL